MDNRGITGVMVALSVGLLLAGCSTQVTYVDEAGNPLAMNARGEPVAAPGTAPGRARPVRSAPVVAGRSPASEMNPAQPVNPPWGVVVEGQVRPAAARLPASASRVAPATAPAAAPAADDLPAPDPSWRVAPQEETAPAHRSEGPTPGAKKVESSAGLGGPPAG